MEDGRGDHYWYDPEGQLFEAYYGAVNPVTNPQSPVRSDYFRYDELGNRTSWNYVANRYGWSSFSHKDNGLNQYFQWYSIVKYDDDIGDGWGSPAHANGVMMMDGNITGGYNALNQPMMIWSANNPGGAWLWFGYDPLGRCVKRWYAQADGSGAGAATYFAYDGWNLVQEGYSPWSPTRFYIHGGSMDEIVQSYNSATGLLAYHYYDASGHCTLLTDGQGTIKEQYYYDAFGYPYFYNGSGGWLGCSPHGNRFLFTGREWLSQLGLYDFRNRLYQPELGRFMQPDPKEFAAGDYNLYRYCHNDPVNRSDPFGDIEQKLLEKLKAVLRAIEKAQRADHQDRTQGVKRDGTLGKEVKGTLKTNHTMGRFERDKMKTEVLPEDSDSLAGSGHYHSAPYYKVKGGDGKWHDTSLPSQEADVAGLKKPMLFGSDPFKASGHAILLEPRKGLEPSQTIIDMQYDK